MTASLRNCSRHCEERSNLLNSELFDFMRLLQSYLLRNDGAMLDSAIMKNEALKIHVQLHKSATQRKQNQCTSAGLQKITLLIIKPSIQHLSI